MLADRLRMKAAGGATDSYFSYVTLLLHGNGPNGSTVFTDNAPTPCTVTGFGNAQISTSQSKFGGASILFDATGDYLTVSPAVNLNPSDFCVEFEVYYTTALTQNPVMTNRSGPSGYWISAGYSSGQLRVAWQQWDVGGIYDAAIALDSPPLNTWVPICIERIGNVLNVYSRGTSIASLNTANRPSIPLSTTYIGQDSGSPGASLNGYLDEIRVTIRPGARYGANYTPATAQFPNS